MKQSEEGEMQAARRNCINIVGCDNELSCDAEVSYDYHIVMPLYTGYDASIIVRILW